MKILIILLFLLRFVTVAADRKHYGDIVIEEVTSIYDAETIRPTIKQRHATVDERIPMRVNSVDAPEIKGKFDKEKNLAREAKQFTVAQLRGAKKIELRAMQRGKYFRILADVYVDGNNLARLLIDNGHARPYDCDTRGGWCEQ